MGVRGHLATATLPCRCGATIYAAGNPAVGVLVLRHDLDERPLGLYDDDPLIARVLARDPAVLEEPPIRAWLRGYHREP
jgi:hypothetical protein